MEQSLNDWNGVCGNFNKVICINKFTSTSDTATCSGWVIEHLSHH